VIYLPGGTVFKKIDVEIVTGSLTLA